jgi:hypothetical protein
MYAELSIYLNFAGVLVWCPRVLVLSGRDAGGGPPSKQLAAATTQRRFVRLFAELEKAICLGLLDVL